MTGMRLPEPLVDLLRRPSLCFLATTMPDGSPQLTETWVDTDGRHVLVNSVEGFRKVRNVERDPQVALNVADPASPAAYWIVRGHVTDVTKEGAREHVERLAQRYLGSPYPWYGGTEQVRVLITIEADRIRPPY